MEHKNLILLYEFLRCGDKIVGVATVILDEILYLASVDAALTVDLVILHLRRVQSLEAIGHVRTRKRPEHSNLDGLVSEPRLLGISASLQKQGCREGKT